MLIAIKLAHTLVWALLAGGILALPILGIEKNFRWAKIITFVVMIECVLLALNDGRCPMTDWAAQFTTDRSPNFDIYLPQWLARHNKLVFGFLFLAGEVTVVSSWWKASKRRQTY
ncbi:MAG TPA: hypothetical protein VD837_18410 [Terriglobales bacterium]|nr:hypothetical protein [Terriglobales bacterium]